MTTPYYGKKIVAFQQHIFKWVVEMRIYQEGALMDIKILKTFPTQKLANAYLATFEDAA